MAAGSPNAEPEAGHGGAKSHPTLFHALYIGEEGISEIIEQAFEVTDPESRELLALGQSERAEAAKRILQPSDVFSSDMRVLNVPAGAALWEEFRRTFPKDTVDESIY
ncbi:hypothetical protein HO133_000762 [Letharia lupina]|uniref:Uncharacterized protein n=1 Tax=Letharia lupina TaxID=560253 RepID=A0A8H6CG22_9LECA|nr:uncharacterized protein HO133_000762 [Letharia lupina]KAF6222715.1 hypothetical protein HO133_000762 [Letharia lupina]